LSLRTRWRPGDRFLVRHKDAAILVVEKKAGLLTVRTPNGEGPNLLALLKEFIGARGPNPGVLPVHRLDRTVSGLLVFARKVAAQEALIEQFRAHTVERRYLAAVDGILTEQAGSFDSFLDTEDPSLRVRSVPAKEAESRGARRAITHWRVLERFERARATLVEVTLETGLRNQIRVHFAEAGHPLLGEKKYTSDEGGQGARRIFLHAGVLGFQHPTTGAAMRFEAELPPDLQAWQGALRHGRTSPPRPPRTRESRARKKRHFER
jgi:23S rRNA pseudouridine1911/1915/1917 synthase